MGRWKSLFGTSTDEKHPVEHIDDIGEGKFWVTTGAPEIEGPGGVT